MVKGMEQVKAQLKESVKLEFEQRARQAKA